jgi:hypothetical protein
LRFLKVPQAQKIPATEGYGRLRKVMERSSPSAPRPHLSVPPININAPAVLGTEAAATGGRIPQGSRCLALWSSRYALLPLVTALLRLALKKSPVKCGS